MQTFEQETSWKTANLMAEKDMGF